MMILKKIWTYLTFRKQSSGGSFNLRMMHGINRISLLMFLVAVIVMVVHCLR